ncbi:porin [Fontivita pretiosa]|uniref:porin n=1 Tax=Fontivita pretiosa TaxID=2989684 RepID=UPI003D175127
MGNRLTVAAALVSSLAGAGQTWAQAPETPEQRMARLEARVQSLESELRAYRDAAGAAQKQYDAHRDAAIADAVEKVLADAQRRSSLLATSGGARVGYAGGFFLADQDNKFQARLNGLLQPRFIYNHNDSSSEDNDELGFQVQRSELYLTGNAFSPQVFWQFSGGFNNSSGGFNIVSAYAGYQFSKTTEIRAGTFKPPFLIEELTAAGRQQAVERSFLNSMFTAGTSEGVQGQYAREHYRIAVMVHDGTNATATNFASDKTDIGIVARGEWKLAGQWSQFADFQGWNDSAFAARLGGAVDYEVGETGDGSDNPDFVKYTLDLTVKSGVAIFCGVR